MADPISASPYLPWVVWKFGGTSVGNAKRLIAAANLICKYFKIPYDDKSHSNSKSPEDKKMLLSVPQISKTSEASSLVRHSCASTCGVYPMELIERLTAYRLAVIVSAMAGVTNELQASCQDATDEFYHPTRSPSDHHSNDKSNHDTNNHHAYKRRLEEIKSLHLKTVDELLQEGEFDQDDAETFKAMHEKDVSSISKILRAFSLSGTSPTSLVEMVMGHGEIWSSRLLFGVVKRRHRSAGRNDSKTHSDRGNSLENAATTAMQQQWNVSFEQHSNKNSDSVGTNGSVSIAAPPTGLTSGCSFCLPCNRHAYGSCQCCRFEAVRWIDARQVLVIEESSTAGGVYEQVSINFPASSANMWTWCSLHPQCQLVFITGYICSTKDGCPSTLKRNGSDYSGSLFAKLFKAKLYTVWTDINGVYTADPTKVPSSFRLPFLSYIEAIELAYFGAKILHPLTMGPCISANIPIIIRSSLHPESPGTLIGPTLPESPFPSTPDVCSPRLSELHQETKALLSPSSFTLARLNPVDKRKALFGYCKAFTLIDDISLVNVTGTSMIGVPGIASRLFSAVHEANCSVAMISQASSEHSICFALLSNQGERAKTAIENAFYKEMSHFHCMKISITTQCTIIACVGERMCGALGVLSRLSTALANADVNVRAIAQGASEFNITFVVDTSAAPRAITAMHDAIYDSEFLTFGTQKSHSARMPQVKEDSNSVPSTRLLSTKETYIRVLCLVPALPLRRSLEAKIHQMVSDIQRRALDPTPLERKGLPVLVVGYTDGFVYVKKLQTHQAPQASLQPAPAVNTILTEKDNQKLFVLIDLRQLGGPRDFSSSSVSTPDCSPFSITMTRDRLFCQSQFVQQWKGAGGIVMDSSGTIQVAPVLESLHRMISISSSKTHIVSADPTETTTSSNGSFITPNDLSQDSNSQLLSEDDSQSPSLHQTPLTTFHRRNRRRSFTVEDVGL